MSTTNIYQPLSASELSAIILKGAKMPLNVERDAGFCSGSSENGDDFHRDSLQSPTDASEDSVEVKLTPIVIPKNKRKSLEPSKVVSELDYPLKKRIKYEEKKYSLKHKHQKKKDAILLDKNPFRPWAPVSQDELLPIPNPAEIYARHPGVTTLHRVPNTNTESSNSSSCSQAFSEQPLALTTKKSHSSFNEQTNLPYFNLQTNHDSQEPTDDAQQHDSCTANNDTMSLNNYNSSDTQSMINNHLLKPSHQRNYKNMTRERRIEANARERTRVHTISAAFDTLRKSVPSYSNTQKLSKLSVLRVACSYILTLSRIVGDDYSPDQSEPPINECVDEVTKTIQTEGKIRKKKDE